MSPITMNTSNSTSRYTLRSAYKTVKRERKATSLFTIDNKVGMKKKKKTKTIQAGKGTPLREIVHIKKNIKSFLEKNPTRAMPALRVLHNLMFGVVGRERSQLPNILRFSGFPEEVTVGMKLRQLDRNSVYSRGRYYYPRLFLSWFGLSTEGDRDQIFHRLLRFMAAPKMM